MLVTFLLSPHQVVTCQRHHICINVISLTMNVLLKNYSKKTVVNFICLNKEFVIVIVIVMTTCDVFLYGDVM